MKILLSWILASILVLAPPFVLYALHNGTQDDIVRDIQHNQSTVLTTKDTSGTNNAIVAPTPDTAEIDTIKTDLKKLRDNFSTMFVTQFSSLASIGVAAALTSISILIAAMVFISNIVINEKVKSTHAEEMAKTRVRLKEITEVYHHYTSAKIYRLFATHSINLYKDLPAPTTGHQKNLYESYLNIAVDTAKTAYRSSEDLQECLRNQNLPASNEQKETIWACVNTYIFYLSERCNRGEHEDMDTVVSILPKLVKIISEIRDQREYRERWCNYQDTIAWANLHLGRKRAQETKNIVQELINLPDISPEWKSETKKRYDFFNKLQTEDENKVHLSLTPPA